MTIRETLTDFWGRLIAQKPMSDAELLRRVADELESLLSAASGEGLDDTKRLDWIARQGGYEFDFGILNDQPGDGDWFVHGMGGSGQGATFRDAIDAAIKEEAGGQDANTDILDTLAFKTENGDAGRGSVTYIALVASGEADHATTTPQLSADAVREIYDAAAKGFHTSETNGAERKYLHVIRFQSIEDLHGYEDAWTAAMVKARDAK